MTMHFFMGNCLLLRFPNAPHAELHEQDDMVDEVRTNMQLTCLKMKTLDY